jgi:uncharacterized protein YceK
MLRKISLVTILIGATGCGTISSMQSQEDLRRDMRARKSHCSFLPHIYSGISYNFCILNAEQSNPKKPDLGMHALILDTALSAIVDTTLTPYTFYKQITRSNISID